MLCEEAETIRTGQALQFIGQLLAQGQHAQTGLFQLCSPIGPQRVVVQDHRNQTRAVIRREGIVLTVEEGQGTLVQRLCACVLRHRHQQARALTVDAEVLGTAGRDQTLGRIGRNIAHTLGVFLQTIAKALIGNVDHRDQTAFIQDRDNFLPLHHVEVGTCRVVAAAMQQDHIAFVGRLQVRDHTVEIDATGFAVEVAIGDRFDVQIVQDRNMVRPGRVRHKNAGTRVGHLDQFKRLAHGAGAPRCCRSSDVAARNAVGQDQLDHRIGIGRITCQTDIGFRGLLFPEFVLCRLDGAHDRRHPFGVLVDAHAKINLGLARIVAIHLHQRQDLVRWLGFQGFEHQASPVATGSVGKAPHSVQEPS